MELWEKRAFTHPCVGRENYQREELLGDRILNMLVMELLFLEYRTEDEGMLSRRLATLVSGATCASVARKLKFQHRINTNGNFKLANADNTLADVMEAYIGALYLWHGFQAAREFVFDHWYPLLQTAGAKDPKTELQEFLQAHKLPKPRYELLHKEGPDHDAKFTVGLSFGEGNVRVFRTGFGKSKKEAEHMAADVALKTLKEHERQHAIRREKWNKAADFVIEEVLKQNGYYQTGE